MSLKQQQRLLPFLLYIYPSSMLPTHRVQPAQLAGGGYRPLGGTRGQGRDQGRQVREHIQLYIQKDQTEEKKKVVVVAV